MSDNNKDNPHGVDVERGSGGQTVNKVNNGNKETIHGRVGTEWGSDGQQSRGRRSGAYLKVRDRAARTSVARINPAMCQRKRIWEVDFLRGVCLLLMLFDHAMYDLAYVFPDIWGKVLPACKFAADYWNWNVRETVWFFAAGSFVFLSGISSYLTRSNFKRGIRLAVFAAALTLGTYLFEIVFGFSGALITFGILHMLAASMLLFACAEWTLKKIKLTEKIKYLDLIIFGVIGVVMLVIGGQFYNSPVIGAGLHSAFVYSTRVDSADYFPILPWCGLLFIGYVFGRLVYANKSGRLGREPKFCKPVTFVGRNTVWFYLGHQPVIFGAIYIIGLILGY